MKYDWSSRAGGKKRFNNGGEEKIRIDKLKSLTEKLQEYIQESIKTDTEYSNKSKTMLKGSLKVAGIKKSEEEIEAMIESDSLENIVTGMLSQASEATRKDLENANERQKELKKCEDAIKEMLDLFKELQQYVEDQGFVLNEIEQKTEITETTIKVAVSHLKDARDIKDMVRRNKKMLWMIFAAVLITFLIIVIASITSQPSENSTIIVIDNKPVKVETCNPMKDYDCESLWYFQKLRYMNQNVDHINFHQHRIGQTDLVQRQDNLSCNSYYILLSFKCAMYYSNIN